MDGWMRGRLLVAGYATADDAPWLVELAAVLGRLGLTCRMTAESRRRARAVGSMGPVSDAARVLLDELWVTSVEVRAEAGQAGRAGRVDREGRVDRGGRAGRVPEAWWVIERVRQLSPTLAERLSLEEAVAPSGEESVLALGPLAIACG